MDSAFVGLVDDEVEINKYDPDTALADGAETAWCPARRYDGAAPEVAELLLHEEVLDFWAAFRPTRAEVAAREELVERVRALAQGLWANTTVRAPPRRSHRLCRCPASQPARQPTQVRAFGSYATGLMRPGDASPDLAGARSISVHLAPPRAISRDLAPPRLDSLDLAPSR